MSVDRILFRKAGRDLRRRRAQLIAVALTVACGLALFASTYDAYLNLETSYHRVYDELNFADLWATGGDTESIVASARDAPGVDAVETRIEADVPLGLGGSRVRGRVVSIPVGEQPAVNKLLLSAGAYPLSADELVLEQHAADTFDLGVGDTVGLVVDGQPREVRISGVAASAEYLWLARSRNDVLTVPDDFGVAFVPQPLAEQAAPDAPTQVAVSVTDGAVLPRLREAALEAGAVEVYDQSEQASNATLQIDVTGFGELAVLFPVLFLTAAGLAVYALLARLVQLDRPIIGALTANGIGRRTVLRHYATHAFVAVGAGAIPGLIVGVVLGRLMTGVYTSELDIPISATQFRPLTLVIGLAVALVTASIVAAVPARAAAKVLPAEALGPPAPPSGGGRTRVERVLPFSLPTGARVALRNLARRPRRAAGTAIGVALAAVVIIASAGLGDSLDASLHRQFSVVDTRDLTAVLSDSADAATVDRIGSIDGVEVAEPSDVVDARLDAGDASAGVEVQLLTRNTRLHGFDRTFDGGLFLSSGTASELGVSPGQDVALTASGVGDSVTLAGVVNEPLGDAAYLDLQTWQSLGGRAAGAVSLRVSDAGRFDAVRSSLESRDDVVAIVDHAALAIAAAGLLSLFDVFIAIMVGFGVVLAVALVFNAITVNVGERTTELATLRAAGIGRRRLHRWVLTETSTVVVLALVPGLVVGGLVAAQFLAAIDTGAFHIALSVHPTTWAWVAALVVVATALAHVPAFRRLDRMDLAATVRERQT